MGRVRARDEYAGLGDALTGRVRSLPRVINSLVQLPFAKVGLYLVVPEWCGSVWLFRGGCWIDGPEWVLQELVWIGLVPAIIRLVRCGFGSKPQGPKRPEPVDETV
jgi:hypothetical protein